MTNGAILRRYVFPNGLSPLIVQCTFVVAFAIISEASLSFLGAGVDPETPTWGNMLRDGQRVLQSAWWLALFPGIALVLTVLTLNLLGDALRDALDPRSEGTMSSQPMASWLIAAERQKWGATASFADVGAEAGRFGAKKAPIARSPHPARSELR